MILSRSPVAKKRLVWLVANLGALAGVGWELLGSGFLGRGTGITTGASSSGAGGAATGGAVGVVKPGEVMRWAIVWLGTATEVELMAIVVIIGTKNQPINVKIR